jgi:tRNA threonylcarbamoyladenosine biosynthesis protein TsaE
MHVSTAREMQELGERLARCLQPGEMLLLHGPLGAGKTTLAQGVARGLGVTVPVTSPTFLTVRVYQGAVTLYHVDLYRVETDEYLWEQGVVDALDEGAVAVVEWAERSPSLVELPHLAVSIGLKGQGRSVRVEGSPALVARWQHG